MRHLAWWLAAVMVAGTAWALDPPSPAPAPAAESRPAGETAPAGAEPAAAEDEPPAAAEEEVPAPGPEARSTGPTPQRFDPSEKVRADFPVSFPIDI